MTRSLKVLCVLAPLVGLGCTGMLDDRSNRRPRDGTTQPGDPNVGGPPVSTPGIPNSSGPAAQPGAGALSDGNSVPGPAPMRRLTRLEYENTLRDLLGVTGAVTSALQVGTDAESGQAGFVKGGAITGGDDARNLMTAATQITDAIKGRLGSLLPCNPLPTAAGEQEACAKKFISDFGKRAYRRPLSDREAELALGLYTTQRGPDVGASFEDAMVAVIAGFIQAPQFLYHWELGPNAPLKDGNLVKYNSYEMASRLSYLLWATMPDDKLFATADARALQTPEQIAGEASRLLADERAVQGLANFQLQWLEIGDLTQMAKDEQQKNWSPAVAKSMLTEVRDFAASVYRGGKTGSTLEAMLTSQTTFADAGLGKIYGLNMTGTDVKEVALNPAQRAGVLTQLAFLSAHADTGDSHPVKRSDALVRRLLCVDLVVPDQHRGAAGGRAQRDPDHARALRRAWTGGLRQGLPPAAGSHRLRLRVVRRHRHLPDHRPQQAGGHHRVADVALGHAAVVQGRTRDGGQAGQAARGAGLHGHPVDALHAGAAGGRGRGAVAGGAS